MKRVDLEKSHCCGCGACANICPKRAIALTADEEGFLYPQIHDALCVDCGLCRAACPAYNERTASGFGQGYEAVQHHDADIVQSSSSGGMFTALADAVLAAGGVIYGAAFEDGFVLRHSRAQSAEEAARFRGSKYIQSDIGAMMQAVRDDLKDGATVLFTGTPCQVHGLRCFLAAARVSTERLLLCDFVCHGVSSPLVWHDYTAFLTARHGSLELYNFRGKANGWHKYFPTVIAGGENVSQQYKEKESYFRLYSTSNITRPSCYACRYTAYERESDLTLADFWNIEKAAPEMDDDKGTSQVLINSAKGRQWFDAVVPAVRHRACQREDVWQPHLEYPIKRPASRDAFWNAYRTLPFEAVIRRYGQYPFVTKCRQAIMPLINKLGLYVLAGKLYRLVFVRKK